jgi:long-chain acyl-CoA synthetase
VREFSLPTRYEVSAGSRLPDLLRDNAARHPKTPVVARERNGGWQDVTAAEFLSEVRAVAKGLVATGVRPGDRIGLLSRTRYEWTLLDFALWTAGAVPVPVYETSSAEQVAWILGDSEAVGPPVDRAVNPLAPVKPVADNRAHLVEYVRVQARLVLLEWAGARLGLAGLEHLDLRAAPA